MPAPHPDGRRIDDAAIRRVEQQSGRGGLSRRLCPVFGARRSSGIAGTCGGILVQRVREGEYRIAQYDVQFISQALVNQQGLPDSSSTSSANANAARLCLSNGRSGTRSRA